MLNNINYADVEKEKFEELINTFDKKYKLYNVQHKKYFEETNEANEANETREPREPREPKDKNFINEDDTYGVEIYEEDIKDNKYGEHITYCRAMIDEYDIIKKDLLYQEFTELEELNNFNELMKIWKEIYNNLSDNLLKLFMDNIDISAINSLSLEISNMDDIFKEKYSKLNTKNNRINNIINNISNTELVLLDTYEKFETEGSHDKLCHIDEILDELINFDSYIYSVNNSYIEYDLNEIIKIECRLNSIINSDIN